MAKDPAIAPPSYEVRSIHYDSECQGALAQVLDKLLDAAAEAGWDRGRAASAVMYLSAKRLSANGAPSQQLADQELP